MKKNRPVILITGASTGLGLSLTKKLIKKDKYHIVTTARSSSLIRFEDQNIIENDHLWIRPLDVTNHGDIYNLIGEINQKLNGVDILVNNAGLSYRSVVEHVTDKERMNQLNINFRAPMELIRSVLPKMREKRCGKIINISSVGGMMAMPTMSVYSASKFALEGATESLWYELKPFGISVTLIQPGFINSDAFTKVKLTELAKKSHENTDDDYNKHYQFMAQFIEKVMKLTPSNKDDVACKVVNVIERKKPPLRVAGTWDARLFGVLRRILPRRIYHWILYKSLPGIKGWGKKTPQER